MTALDHSSYSRSLGATGFVARVAAAAGNVFAAWKNRREIYRLGEMSDAELSDIGLTRGDLHVAIDAPFGVDPTASLARMARSNIASLERAARQIS